MENPTIVEEKLAQLEKELQEFTYFASHELQEPLRKVTSFGNRLKQVTAEKLNDKESDYLNRMIHATERMQAMVDGLFAYSRVETAGRPFDAVDMKGVIEKSVSSMSRRYKALDPNIELDLKDLPIIQGDSAQVRQLFENILDNALKFHREEVTPHIKIMGSLCEAGYCFRIEDNGIGFDVNHENRVFQLFQTLHGRGEYTGAGMGLPVCKRIIERHKGSIAACENDKEGITLALTFPMLNKNN